MSGPGDSVLFSYSYQYLVGGLVFVAGLAVGFRTGYLARSGPGARRLLLLVAGLLWFAALQGALLLWGH